MLRSFNENSLENAAIENSNVKMKRSTGRRKNKRRNNIRNKRRKPHNRRKKNRKRKTKKRQNITRRNNRNRKTRKIKSMRQSIVFTGESCQYVDFGSVRSSGSGCADGTKMVLKNQWDIFHPSISRYFMFTMSLYPRAGVNRKQFLIADSKTIYAFVAKGEKFPTCSSFTDKTCDVQCKVK